MAITPTVLTKGGPSGGLSINTASISPTTARLLIVMVARAENGTPVAPTLSGLGLTWVQAVTQVGGGNSGTISRVTVFYAWSTGATPGVLTITHASTTGGDQTEWIVSEWSGTLGSADNGASGVRQAISGNNVDLDLTLAALATSASASVGFLLWNSGATYVLGSGYTLLDNIQTGNWNVASEYKSPGATVVDWGGGGNPYPNQHAYIALELAADTSVYVDVGLAEATATALAATPSTTSDTVIGVGIATTTAEAFPVLVGTVTSPNVSLARKVELGCGTYRALLTERGGINPVMFLPFSNLSWGRIVDDSSSGSLTAPFSRMDADEFSTCCAVFNDAAGFNAVDNYSHEIAVLRDDEQVWCGPITGLSFSFNQVSIQMRDLFHWFDRRYLPVSRDEIGDLASLFQLFALDALNQDTSPNITLSPFAMNTISRRTALKQDYINAGNFLREIGKDGVDFTMLGRTLYEGNLDGVASDLGVELRLPQQAIKDGTLEKRGAELSTELTLTGRPPGGSVSTIAATVGGFDPKYGLVQTQQSESFITVPAFLENAAKARYEMVKTPPRYLDIELDPKAPFLMNQLLAGFLMDVKCWIGCANVVEVMRLHQLQVTVNVSDDGAESEKIEATIVPKGQPTYGFDLGFGGFN